MGSKAYFFRACCQHEVNKKIKSDKFSLLTKYGIIKDRFSALITDSIRANMLEYSGYKTNIMEFIDMTHTPKNLLIRAVYKGNEIDSHARKKALRQVLDIIDEFGAEQTLYKLLTRKNNDDSDTDR